MPDSKWELRRYATEYETETGRRWWTNPVSHGEQGFASDDFLYWFAFALSTAEQRLEEANESVLVLNRKLVLTEQASIKAVDAARTLRGELQSIKELPSSTPGVERPREAFDWMYVLANCYPNSNLPTKDECWDRFLKSRPAEGKEKPHD